MALNPKCTPISKVPSATEKSTTTVQLGAAFAAIRSDRFRAAVRWVRDCLENGDDEAAREAKLALPAIMPSGTFRVARADGIQRYSGMICADLDKLDEDQMAHALEWIEGQPTVAGWFRSPSGNGIKAFVRTQATDHNDHWRAWCSVRAMFAHGGLTLDPQTADLPRLCFVSWDPRATLRPADALPLLESVPEQPQRVERCTLVAPVDASAAMRDAVRALADHGPAIEGQGGDLHTMKACQIGHDFGIPAVDWLPALRLWNAQCTPPWSDHGLRSKLRSSYANSKRAFGSAGMFAGVFG